MPDSSDFQSYAQVLKLVPLGDTQYAAPASTAAPDESWIGEKTRNRRIKFILFALLIVLPTIVAGIYFGLIAANRYESEARFVIRTPGSAIPNPLTSLVQSSGITRANDDAYAVREYILSRDAM